MADDEPQRSAAARAAAELALVRVVRHYGGRPEFVLLGGLVPALLCSGSAAHHAGTNDVDVQVDLEISNGSVHAARLERALRQAGFSPDDQYVWRWKSTVSARMATVKFELLADLNTQPSGATIRFRGCRDLGAANLRGTGFAAQDCEVRTIGSSAGDLSRSVEINVSGLAGFLLAKTAAAYSRRKPKDWYDLVFVLLNNDHGDALAAAQRVRQLFGASIPAVAGQLTDLSANFAGPDAQGTRAYADQITLDHPEIDPAAAAADGQLAVNAFCSALLD
jgi:Nucleotidyl transferase AbiEii toxin, Type IV TA system